MYVKIQGGGKGLYSNSSSSENAVLYLERGVDKDIAASFNKNSYFFNHTSNHISADEVIISIDANRGQLRKDEAKFFMLTISPSAEEVTYLGKNKLLQEKHFKQFIVNQVMNLYADNFNKGLIGKDLRYYAIIHENRGTKTENQLHAHIIVSRKTDNGKIKISPQTNHKNSNIGIIRGGFDRRNFFSKVEQSFDDVFSYSRSLSNTFDFKNAVKKGQYNLLETMLYSQSISKIDTKMEIRSKREPNNKRTKLRTYKL